jgi:uncharacterized protein YecT (DUF1311 family)
MLISLVFAASSAQESPKLKDAHQACDEAKSQMELNQCAGEQYKKADERLNAVYRRALEFMQKDLAEARERKDADQVKYNQLAIEKLKAAERAWVQYRDLHCEAARHQYEGGSMNPMVWGFCMEQTAGDRIEELKFAYEGGERKLE